MKHVPNILTISRIVMVPIFLALYFYNHWATAAAVVILAAITDVADGYIARKYHIVSVFGQILDPLADKLMQLSVILALWLDGKIPKWAIMIIATKELIMICGGSILFFFKKKSSIPAEWYGKATTVLFYVTMLYIIIFDKNKGSLSGISLALVGITVFAMVYSLIRYFSHFVKLTKKPHISA